MDKAIRDAVGSLRGASVDEVTQRTRDFWLEEVVETIRPGARRAIDRHRERGDLVVILTSSSSYLCASVMTELPLEIALCNRLQEVDGYFTGALEEPICFGEGKVSHARRLVEQEGIELSNCSFYTDSYSDLPVMELVGCPVAVHPDPRLARLARRRGWQIVDWD
jgi:HAD superfamily hydrolase (TIGR01490 family)